MASKDSSDPDLDQRIAARWLDVLIRACQLLSLVLLSFRALAPFLVLMVWALILAVTLHPLHLAIARNQDVLTYGAQQASADFAAQHSTPQRQFLLAAGSAGIDAATNIVVRQAWTQMLLLVYAAVTVLCFITFRNWRAVVVAIVPLVVTSFLCEALMVGLGIGVKVATLPVVALGVGIGIDYALYLLSVQLAQQRVGVPLREAYRRALQFTGKVVVLVGVTLAAGVVTWAFSPIKFQADMGILLAFMFVWNMVGAVILIPALSHFLLPDGLHSRQAQPAVGTTAAA